MKNLFQFLAASLIVVGMFSCSVIDITKKRYSNGYYLSSSNGAKVEGQNNNIVKVNKSEIKREYKVEEHTATHAALDNVTEISTVQKTQNDISITSDVESLHKKKHVSKAQNKPVFAIKSSKLAVSSIQMQEQKMLNKTKHNSSSSDDRLILLVILAILLPPLAVFLKRGLDTMFWISLLLTLLFWFPGVIFALLIVLDAI